ncbi:MAG TPA: hypothetical protein VFA90_02970 [Terriglobales bacterium]|nr:hypothetical protein [Terriglobales bacterium]
MNYSVPDYLTPFIVTGMVAITATILFGLRRALQPAESSEKAWPEKGWSNKAKNTAFWSLAVLLLGWFTLAVITAKDSFYRPPEGSPPTIQYGLLTPIVVGLLLFWTWPLLRRTLAIIPNTWLVGVQTYRMLGAIFVVLYAGQHLPWLFALPAGIGDFLVGIAAPFVAAAYASTPERAGRRVRIWNLLGIADLVIAVTMGFITSPSPFQLAAFDRPSGLIGMFPLVLIPVFAVPLSVLLHLASLHKLRQQQMAGYRPQAQIGSAANQAIG